MRKDKFIYNDQTLQYEKYKPNQRDIFLKLARFTMSVVAVSAVAFWVRHEFFPTPKEQAMERELQQMEYHYDHLKENFTGLSKEIEALHDKDASVHRMILGVNPMDENIWEGGIGGVERHTSLNAFGDTGNMIKEMLALSEKLNRKADIQNLSLDSLSTQAKAKEKKLASVPSIKPIVETKLKRGISSLSGYGMRIHPIHKVKKLHKGIDFTAPKGTAIQATGDGVVKRVQKRKRGYGRNVIIDHGYGYTSLYAHMSRVDVKKGQKVKKGQLIGLVGSTGTSTAPHLHYEVRLKNRAVNPINYVLDGLSPAEYKEMVAKASIANQSFD